MKTISISVPEMSDLNTAQLSMVLASKLYEEGRLSLGQAAEMVSLSKRAFIELLGFYNVSVFNYPPSDLAKDVTNAYSHAI